MKLARITVLGLVALLLGTLAGTAAAAAPLDAAERATLLSLREEEKLAHDVYAALHARWGDRIFLRIAASEERHALALERALAAYGVDDPTDGLAAGRFATTAFQQLYDDLVARGSTSLAAAVDVGIWIETHDIADLEAAIAQTDEALLDRVYRNLLAGSTRHLAAFERHPGTTVAPAAQAGRPAWAGGRHGRA